MSRQTKTFSLVKYSWAPGPTSSRAGFTERLDSRLCLVVDRMQPGSKIRFRIVLGTEDLVGNNFIYFIFSYSRPVFFDQSSAYLICRKPLTWRNLWNAPYISADLTVPSLKNYQFGQSGRMSTLRYNSSPLKARYAMHSNLPKTLLIRC